MRKTFLALLPLLPMAVLAASPAYAQEVNVWRKPGLSPYAATKDEAMSARERAFRCLGFKGQVLEQMMRVTSVPGRMEPLVDGEVFTRQVYKDCQVVKNVKVAFGDHGYNRSAERWDPILLPDGSTMIIVHPYGCHNWSVIIIPPKRVVKEPCVIHNYDYSRSSRVAYWRADALAARGLWQGSKAQLTLHPKAQFSFTMAHIEVTDAEYKEMIKSDCFGYGDETGFHHEVWKCVEFCVVGQYPSPQMIEALRRERGIELPSKKPRWSIRFPLKNGKGYFSYPVRFADRFRLDCVEVRPHLVTLKGFGNLMSVTDFDIITAAQAKFSLKTNFRQNGNIIFTDDKREVRYLFGQHGF